MAEDALAKGCDGGKIEEENITWRLRQRAGQGWYSGKRFGGEKRHNRIGRRRFRKRRPLKVNYKDNKSIKNYIIFYIEDLIIWFFNK